MAYASCIPGGETIEGELIIVTLISTLGGLIGLSFVQRFWDHKWDKNFSFEKWKLKEHSKRQKQARDFKIKHPEPKNVVNKAMDLIPILNKLDTDQLKILVDKFLPSDYEYEEDNTSNAIADLIGGVDKDLIKGFLEGISKKKKGSVEEKSDMDFWT